MFVLEGALHSGQLVLNCSTWWERSHTEMSLLLTEQGPVQRGTQPPNCQPLHHPLTSFLRSSAESAESSSKPSSWRGGNRGVHKGSACRPSRLATEFRGHRNSMGLHLRKIFPSPLRYLYSKQSCLLGCPPVMGDL